MCSGQRRWRNTSFNACRICGASAGGANDGGHRDSTCRVSGACISWARSASTIGGARRANSSQVRSIAVCIVPVPVVSEALVQAVRTAPAPGAEASRCRNQRCCGVAPLSTAVASCRVFAAFGVTALPAHPLRCASSCATPAPAERQSAVHAVPAPVAEYIVLVSAVSVAPAPAVDAVPSTIVWRTATMPHALAVLTMKPVVKAASDVSKSSWRCCCRSSNTRRRLAGEAHRDVRESLFERSVGTWSICDAQTPNSFLSGRCLVQRPTCDFCEQVWRRLHSAKDLLLAFAEEATLTRTKTLMAGALVLVMRWTVFLSWLRHCQRVQHSGQTA